MEVNRVKFFDILFRTEHWNIQINIRRKREYNIIILFEVLKYIINPLTKINLRQKPYQLFLPL